MVFNNKKLHKNNKKYLLESHNFQNGILHLSRICQNMPK